MKFAEELFPKGTYPRQESDGFYIDETLAANLDLYAKKIVDDMHFLILITGNDSVGNGKTTLATQIGSYLTWKTNKLHNVNNTFTHKNLVFKGSKLVENSLASPKLSVQVLDEGDDLTTHGAKQQAQDLKRYFRKCRQLNQILILILPSFFELPKFYALSRSHCLINVKFANDFERGSFDFYGPRAKKLLYLKGKKEWDYDAAPKDFPGYFASPYCFFPNSKEEAELYKQSKYSDMVDDADEHKQKPKAIIEYELRAKLFRQCSDKLPEITQKRLCEAFGIDKKTAWRYLYGSKDTNEGGSVGDGGGLGTDYTNNPIKDGDDVDGGEG